RSTGPSTSSPSSRSAWPWGRSPAWARDSRSTSSGCSTARATTRRSALIASRASGGRSRSTGSRELRDLVERLQQLSRRRSEEERPPPHVDGASDALAIEQDRRRVRVRAAPHLARADDAERAERRAVGILQHVEPDPLALLEGLDRLRPIADDGDDRGTALLDLVAQAPETPELLHSEHSPEAAQEEQDRLAPAERRERDGRPVRSHERNVRRAISDGDDHVEPPRQTRE